MMYVQVRALVVDMACLERVTWETVKLVQILSESKY